MTLVERTRTDYRSEVDVLPAPTIRQTEEFRIVFRRGAAFDFVYGVEDSEEWFYETLGMEHNVGHRVHVTDRRPYVVGPAVVGKHGQASETSPFAHGRNGSGPAHGIRGVGRRLARTNARVEGARDQRVF